MLTKSLDNLYGLNAVHSAQVLKELQGSGHLQNFVEATVDQMALLWTVQYV